MNTAAEDPSDEKHLAEATMRALIALMLQTGFELVVFMLVCFLGTALLILTLQRL